MNPAKPPHSVIAWFLADRKLRAAVAGFFDPELIHAVSKRVRMEVQDLRRALRTVNHSVRLFQSGEDVASLHLLQSWKRLSRGVLSLPNIGCVHLG